MELKLVSPLPWPPTAGAKVGRDAVVIFLFNSRLTFQAIVKYTSKSSLLCVSTGHSKFACEIVMEDCWMLGAISA